MRVSNEFVPLSDSDDPERLWSMESLICHNDRQWNVIWSSMLLKVKDFDFGLENPPDPAVCVSFSLRKTFLFIFSFSHKYKLYLQPLELTAELPEANPPDVKVAGQHRRDGSVCFNSWNTANAMSLCCQDNIKHLVLDSSPLPLLHRALPLPTLQCSLPVFHRLLWISKLSRLTGLNVFLPGHSWKRSGLGATYTAPL